jgi:glucose/arabinose dehydrogenase
MFKRAVASMTLALATTTAMAGEIAPLDSVRIASGLNRPIYVTHAPGDYTRIYIIEKRGVIRVMNIKTGAVQPVGSAFLDISATSPDPADRRVGGGTSTSDERGLLGLAFHPNFEKNGYFYVNFTDNSGFDTQIMRFTASSKDSADASTASLVWEFHQPFTNHNGGWIGFGPNDGYLYISTGDGGSAGDPNNRAQDITSQPLGKMLRIDVDSGSPYGIPASNPFVDVTGDDEIWAYGLRNVWRPSFDRGAADGTGKGDLYLADVGQNLWEEISYQPASSKGGENYGWRCREGAHNYNFTGACSSQTFVEPFQEYSHSGGQRSITGGYVYRGCRIPSLDGTYFYADYSISQIWSLDAGGVTTNFRNRTSELAPDAGGGTIGNIASFGEDLRGEMYICDQSGGEIFQIIPKTEVISFADTNCDGVVDALDYLKVIAEWGDCDGCVTDYNGDGVVDALDFLLMIAEWG